jgi:hypothetical protein
MRKARKVLGFMTYVCGQAAHKTGFRLWVPAVAMHKPSQTRQALVGKVPHFSWVFSQVGTFLCTFFHHTYAIFLSVINRFVHIIHTPYKNNYKVYILGVW